LAVIAIPSSRKRCFSFLSSLPSPPPYGNRRSVLVAPLPLWERKDVLDSFSFPFFLPLPSEASPLGTPPFPLSINHSSFLSPALPSYRPGMPSKTFPPLFLRPNTFPHQTFPFPLFPKRTPPLFPPAGPFFFFPYGIKGRLRSMRGLVTLFPPFLFPSPLCQDCWSCVPSHSGPFLLRGVVSSSPCSFFSTAFCVGPGYPLEKQLDSLFLFSFLPP